MKSRDPRKKALRAISTQHLIDKIDPDREVRRAALRARFDDEVGPPRPIVLDPVVFFAIILTAACVAMFITTITE